MNLSALLIITELQEQDKVGCRVGSRVVCVWRPKGTWVSGCVTVCVCVFVHVYSRGMLHNTLISLQLLNMSISFNAYHFDASL